MKALYTVFWSGLLSVLFVACSNEPPVQEIMRSNMPEPVPYLYKPPLTPASGIAIKKLKNEEFAEAFVSRLSTKAPAGVVVMQQEKLVLEEYYNLDSTALICVSALFPAFAGAMIGSTATANMELAQLTVPLQELYALEVFSSSFMSLDIWWSADPLKDSSSLQLLDQLIQKQSGTTKGMAAEEFLLEPLQIDDYSWTDSALCLHPHAFLQLGSLLVRRGRWDNNQVLPDNLVKRILAPAYEGRATEQKKAYGWHYFRLVAKGRKQPVLYWRSQGVHLLLLPEIEAVILLQGNDMLMEDAWPWLQEYLIPSLT